MNLINIFEQINKPKTKMKKIKLLLSVAMLSYTMVNAQATERNTLKEFTVNTTKFTANQRVSGTDTMYYAFCSYQNRRYTSINDTEIIMFTKAGLDELIVGFEYILTKDKSESVEYNCPISKSILMNSKYGIALYSKSNKYTMITRKALIKNIEELKTLSELIK